MARNRIGFMGGSFNPIHRRHLQIADCALHEMQLDRVLFVPNGNPPHKHADLVDAKHRFEMTRLAVMPYEKFTISDIETAREGVVYAVDTLKLLHGMYPNADFIYIIGEDTLFDLENWYQPSEVFKLCSFAVCRRQRPNVEIHPFVQFLRAQGAVIRFLSLAPFDISASDIRRQIAQGVMNDALLTPEVCEYIRVMGLYGRPPLWDGARQAYGMLKEDLSDDRLLHSLAVAYTANRLALIHGLDAQACEIAALLHDCTKCMSLKTQQQIARDNNLKLLDMELDSVGLLHGPVSAVIAKEKYGIQQKDILAAIGAHTTGFAGMSEFDMVIFLADKIEPYRSDLPQLDEIRALANVDLYQAAYLTLCNSKAYILKTNRPLHPATDKTIQWVHDRMQRKEKFWE